ncbi:hypothetical protein D9M72_449710 [compost metagenome]
MKLRGDLGQPALPGPGAGAVADIDGFGLVPGACKRPEAIAAVRADPGFRLFVLGRRAGYAGKDALDQRRFHWRLLGRCRFEPGQERMPGRGGSMAPVRVEDRLP